PLETSYSHRWCRDRLNSQLHFLLQVEVGAYHPSRSRYGNWYKKAHWRPQSRKSYSPHGVYPAFARWLGAQIPKSSAWFAAVVVPLVCGTPSRLGSLQALMQRALAVV